MQGTCQCQMTCFSGGPYGIFSIIDSGVLVTHGPSKLTAFRGGRTKENYEGATWVWLI